MLIKKSVDEMHWESIGFFWVSRWLKSVYFRVTYFLNEH